MNINDIVALAKNGYKPGDIKALLEMANTIEAVQEPAEEEKEDSVSLPKAEAQKEPEVDYKALYEEAASKNEKLAADLKIAQKANVSQNVKADTISDEDAFKSILRDFM